MVAGLALEPRLAEPKAHGQEKVPAQVVTIKGNVLCNRATDAKPWFWDPKDGDHTPIIYALAGTPAIAEQLDKVMASYPGPGLDVEAAVRVQDAFDRRLKYFIAPGPIVARIHKEVEAGSQLLAVTGTVAEHDGKRWISPQKYEPAQVDYPTMMRAPDRPFAAAGAKPLLLKVSDALALRCILLPPGRFLQGSPFYQRRYQDEYPHEVVLTRPFAISETPVTQEMFEAVLSKNPSPEKGPRLPVENASYADILEFCRVLSQRNGITVRLPTDAEWEYAARVGTSNPCLSEKYKDQISPTGGRHDRTPVGSKQPNAWGLYDMLCGGWHLTADYKADNVRTRQVDPTGPVRGDGTVHRDASGWLHKTRGGQHYDHIRPNIHGAAAENGTIWESGSLIFRVVAEPARPRRTD
jgi:formylglycine-generating enzyme required for sulfatase activity